MMRRYLICLLLAIMPLQAIAAIHMALAAAPVRLALAQTGQVTAAAAPAPHAAAHAGHMHMHVHEHSAQATAQTLPDPDEPAQPAAADHRSGQHQEPGQHDCQRCDLCVPPLAPAVYTISASMSAVAAPAAAISSSEHTPLLFDRPPRS